MQNHLYRCNLVVLKVTFSQMDSLMIIWQYPIQSIPDKHFPLNIIKRFNWQIADDTFLVFD